MPERIILSGMKYFISILSLVLSLNATAAIKTESVEYKDGDATLEGYIAYDTNLKGKLPGVIVVHNWMGISEDTKARAQMLAKLGYVAFAADIYGKGIRAKNPAEAAELAGKYKGDRKLLRSRINSALSTLQKNKSVDTKKIAAIGYCFGGTTALELARSGADIKGIVSFHGGLDTPVATDAKNIKAKVLVLHGADDPYVPADQVAAFESEMRNGKVDWQLVKYANAVHAFTEKSAGNDNSKGAAYNEKADQRSWIAMKDFFKEIF